MWIKKRVLVSILLGVARAQSPIDHRSSGPAVIPDSVSVESNIAYDQYKETVLDVLAPKAPSKQKRPGVILIHGGGWVNGTKEARVEYAALKYVENGFVVANVEYRLAKAATAPAAVTDVLKAAQWFRNNARKYNVDPKRIIVTGDSAGGHLALMVAMTPKSAKLGPPAKVAAVVNFYGITDVDDQLEGPHMQKYAVTWVPEQAGRHELAKRVSPMTYVRKDLPPILTLHGDVDKTVPYEHGAKLTRALKEAGADARLITVSGSGHGFQKAILDEQFPHIFAFLKEKGVI
ncbi:MAG TPA: alpha/beta hydrolase [Bryobacteraceae bacterium]|nr:alpha/beta hydrolase [Bryobacteraceae bacterium]